MTAGFVSVTIIVKTPGKLRGTKVIRLVADNLFDGSVGYRSRIFNAKEMIGNAFIEAYERAVAKQPQSSKIPGRDKK